MPSIKLSQLPVLPLTPPLDGSEVMFVNKGPTTYKTTVAALLQNQIDNYANANIDELNDIRAIAHAEMAEGLMRIQETIINFIAD